MRIVSEKQRKATRWTRVPATLAAAGLCIALCAFLLWGMLPLLGRMTFYSAGLALPDGALALMARRYAPLVVTAPPVNTPSSPATPDPSDRHPDPEGETSGGEDYPLPPDTHTTLPPEDIPDEYRGVLVQETMAGAPQTHISIGTGYLRNYTQMSTGEIAECLATPSGLMLDDSDEPQVLIVHTHATESYEHYDADVYDTRNNWRSLDNTTNVVALGDELAKALEAEGIGVIHDTTKHDYPSYNGSYERSAKTIEQYLADYPSIKVVLDIHRDAIEREDSAIVKPVTEVNGVKAAQVMVIAPCDDGKMNMPLWRDNLRFAAALTNAIEADYPTLTRPVFFCYRKYNMDLTPGSLLLEFGSNANTLDEAIYSARLVGKSLAQYLKSTTVE